MKQPHLSPQQFLTLSYIRSRKHGLTATEIADRLGRSLSQVSRLVQALADLGLIERRFDPDDARRHPLIATRQGERVGLRAKDFVATHRRRTTEDLAS